jgi:hypothetical protein
MTSSLITQAKSSNKQERNHALSSLIYATNRSDQETRQLFDQGLLSIVMDILNKYPPTHKCWDDDSIPEPERDEWWLAFDIITNCGKAKSCHPDLLQAHVVEFLAPLMEKENYFGFESTEGLAYIIGADDTGKHSKLLQGKPRNVQQIIEVFDSTLNGSGVYFGMGFSVYGRVLAIQCLSVSDLNKPMLKPAIPLMLQVIQNGEDRCVPLALKFLLEMTFIEDIMDSTRIIPGIRDILRSVQRLDEDCKKMAETLIYRFDEDERMDKVRAEKLVIVSCCEEQGDVVRLFVERLRAANMHVFFTLDDTKDDIEKLGDAIQRCSYFFMCMSAEYRESANCRGEANFAKKAKKAMCPLMVQAGYEPSGWLGLLAGQQMYYMLTKPEELDMCCQKVIPLAMVALGTTATTDGGLALPPSSPKNNNTTATAQKVMITIPPSVLNMTTDQVQEFIVKKCNLPKSSLYVKKNGITGKTLGMIWDHYSRGGAVIDTLMKLLGLSSVANANDVLFELNGLCMAQS